MTRDNDQWHVDHLNSWCKWIFYFNKPDALSEWLIWRHCTVRICYNKSSEASSVWSSEIGPLISTSEQRMIFLNICLRSSCKENREQGPQSIKQWSQIHKWEVVLKFVELDWKTMTWKLFEPSFVGFCPCFCLWICSGIKSGSSDSTIFCFSIQRNRVKSNFRTIICWSNSIFVTCKEVQSFLFKYLETKFKNIQLFIVCYLLIWVNYTHILHPYLLYV